MDAIVTEFEGGKGRYMLSTPPRQRGRRRKYTREFLLTVPEKLLDGASLEQIAATVDGKVSTILVLCAKHKIALPSKRRIRTFVRLRFNTVKKMQDYAVAKGITYNELAERLLDVIAKDNMFKAILDD